MIAAALILAGCGSSAPSNREQIAAIIKQEGTRPASLCAHLTPSLLATLGGRSGCLRQAASAVADPTTHAVSIEVRGKHATAVEVDRNGSHTLRLVKLAGSWKLAGVK